MGRDNIYLWLRKPSQVCDRVRSACNVLRVDTVNRRQCRWIKTALWVAAVVLAVLEPHAAVDHDAVSKINCTDANVYDVGGLDQRGWLERRRTVGPTTGRPEHNPAQDGSS